MKPHGGSSGASDEIIAAMKKVNHRNFSIWYDAGNIIYYTGKDPIEELKPIVQYVTGFCAKDCGPPKGDVMIQFGTGKVDFRGVFKVMDRGVQRRSGRRRRPGARREAVAAQRPPAASSPRKVLAGAARGAVRAVRGDIDATTQPSQLLKASVAGTTSAAASLRSDRPGRAGKRRGRLAVCSWSLQPASATCSRSWPPPAGRLQSPGRSRTNEAGVGRLRRQGLEARRDARLRDDRHGWRGLLHARASAAPAAWLNRLGGGRTSQGDLRQPPSSASAW